MKKKKREKRKGKENNKRIKEKKYVQIIIDQGKSGTTGIYNQNKSY